MHAGSIPDAGPQCIEKGKYDGFHGRATLTAETANFNYYNVDGVFGRDTGPTGQEHKIFEEVSKLPRRQQEKIVEVVSTLVNQYAQDRQ